jgi:hypothetical protein
MMQVQVEIDLSGEQSRVNIHQLAREDATPDERGYAQAIEDVLVDVLKQAHAQAGTTLDVAYIIEPETALLRELAAAADAWDRAIDGLNGIAAHEAALRALVVRWRAATERQEG